MGRHELTDRTVLVTGGAGFIGSHLVDALVERNTVRVLDDLSSGDRSNVHPEAELIRGDVGDRGAVSRAIRDVDVVFHHAALVSVDRSIETPQRSQAVNVGGTLTVLEAARATGSRVVLASSAGIYGHPASVPVTESAPKSPISPYGVDKLAADHYARLYSTLYDLPTVVLRYFNVYGPRQRGGDYSGVISAFLERAIDDRQLTVHGEGTQTRDFVHVADVVRANLLAATTECVGEAYNIGTGRSVTINELADLVLETIGSSADIVHTETRPGDIERSRADISKARARIGFEPTVELDEGIRSLMGQWTADSPG